MKKKAIMIVALALFLITLFAGCNYRGYDFVDNDYHFDRAIICMPNGEVIEVEVAKWADAEGEQLTITTTDGTRYLVHANNCILIED